MNFKPTIESLEQDGIIKRKVYVSKPPMKVGYTLTELGKTLIEFLKSIARWGKFLVNQQLPNGSLPLKPHPSIRVDEKH